MKRYIVLFLLCSTLAFAQTLGQPPSSITSGSGESGVVGNCNTIGGNAYYAAAGTTITCSPDVIVGTSSLQIIPGATVTLPDSSTITTSGYNSLSFVGIGQIAPTSNVLGITGITQTGAMSSGIANLTQTWNTSAGPTALSIAITNTASTGGLLVNLLAGAVGATSEFKVDMSGNATAAATVTGAALSATAGAVVQTNSISSPFTAASFRNSNAGASAATGLSIGNNASVNEFSIGVNSSTNATGNGASSTTMNAVSGLFLQTNGANTISINTSQLVTFGGQIAVSSMTQSAAAQSGTMCYNTTSGTVTYDATLGCLTSLEELKDIHGPITGALDKVAALKPFWFTPIDRPAGSDLREQPGFGAHQVEAVDKRLVGYGADGELRGVRYMEMTAVLAAAINELKADNDNLRREVETLRAGMR